MNERLCLLFHRCANCFDCPGCMHTLSTRATSISTQLPDDPAKTTMKKAYYLACGFCRWTSRDVGMADKSVGEWGGLKHEILWNWQCCNCPQIIIFNSYWEVGTKLEYFVIKLSVFPSSDSDGPWCFIWDWVNYLVFLEFVK